MKLLVVESISGGASWPSEPSLSLRREGAAMLGVLLEDLVQVEGLTVTTLLDSRFEFQAHRKVRSVMVDSAESWNASLPRYARESDAVWLIAPEIEGELLRLARLVTQSGTQLLSPGLELIELASDKQATCEWLGERGVPVPRGICWNANKSNEILFPFPAVAKPIDGAGSLHSRMLQDRRDLNSLPDGDWRIEQFQPGQPCSVALLVSGKSTIVLGTANQSIAPESFEYRGGSTPLPHPLSERATALGRQVANCLPSSFGYVGIDLILGEQSDGRDDVVVEVNPRLTTSYLGLRQAIDTNLAEIAICSFRGEAACAPRATERVTFLSDGTITSRSPLADATRM